MEEMTLANGPPRTRNADDAADDAIDILDDVVLADAEDVPTELSERAIAVRVEARTALVVRRAVHFHDEAHARAGEVDDGRSDDQLAAKCETGLGAGELAPEVLFSARWRAAHDASALLEQLCASGRDETTSEHADLRAKGADARRAEIGSEIG